MTSPTIAILPYTKALGPSLARLPLSELVWPHGCPARLTGGCVGDLGPEDHLMVFPRTGMHFRLRRGTRAKISVILIEPSLIHARHLRLLRATWRRFHRILTFNEDLIARVPNAVFFPLGTTWVPEWQSLDRRKSQMCSLIASEKRDSTGHKLRHAIADWALESGQDMTLLGRGYVPFEDKADGLARFRYSVVIENIRERNYFSEKLVDAVLCDTVPIYWGCPNPERFFDPSGMILCETEADLRRAIEGMSEEDYTARLPAIRAIQPVLAQYGDLYQRVADALAESL